MLVLSTPRIIAYSQPIIICCTVSYRMLLLCSATFSLSNCVIHVISFLSLPHPLSFSSPAPFLQLNLPSPLFPFLLSFLCTTLFFFLSLRLSCSLTISSLVPSLSPGTVYNLLLFFSSFLPLPFFFILAPLSCTLFNPPRQSPYALSVYMLKA